MSVTIMRREPKFNKGDSVWLWSFLEKKAVLGLIVEEPHFSNGYYTYSVLYEENVRRKGEKLLFEEENAVVALPVFQFPTVQIVAPTLISTAVSETVISAEPMTLASDSLYFTETTYSSSNESNDKNKRKKA